MICPAPPCSMTICPPATRRLIIGIKTFSQNNFLFNRSSYQHNKTVAATAKKIFMGEKIGPIKQVSEDHALWLLTQGEGFGKLQYRSALLSLNFLKINPNFRKVKTSFSRENICTFPSYEKLSQHWRSNIVVEAHPVYEGDTDIINGMFFDPAEFLPRHMARWLEKRDLEGSPLPPGCYRVKFKV